MVCDAMVCDAMICDAMIYDAMRWYGTVWYNVIWGPQVVLSSADLRRYISSKLAPLLLPAPVPGAAVAPLLMADDDSPALVPPPGCLR